jgi:hypothetical protein
VLSTCEVASNIAFFPFFYGLGTPTNAKAVPSEKDAGTQGREAEFHFQTRHNRVKAATIAAPFRSTGLGQNCTVLKNA